MPLDSDTINLILDLLFWEYDGSIDRASLAAASRISRLWRAAAQSRLFETVEIQSRQTLNSFVRSASASSKRGRQLRAMVLQLSIVISGHTSVLGIAPSHSLLERDMLTLLPTLPNLYILVVNSFAPSISRAGQRALQNSQIKSLVVRYIGEPPDRRHQIFFNFLTSLPLLERVMFIGKGTYLFPSSLPADSPVPPHPQVLIRELRLDLRHSQPSLKGSDLAWLIGHSPTHLSVLHLYDLVLDPSMTPFMISVAPQLRSFHVCSSRHSDLKDLPRWVECMTGLEELVVRNDIRSAADCFRVATDLPLVLKVLPETVQHLGLAVDSQNALDTVKLQVKKWATRYGVVLKVLTLVLTATEPLEPWAPMIVVRRTRLFRHTDVDVLFSFLTPLLPTESFPRYVETKFRGRIAIDEGKEEQRRKFSPSRFLQHLVKGN